MKRILTCVSSCLIFSIHLSTSFSIPSIQSNSLLKYASSKYSQRGEEGILSEILKRLKITKGFFVEFGAADGIMLSNTRFLVEKNWKGAFIESDKKLFDALVENYKASPDIICIKEMVSWYSHSNQGKTFDEIADLYFPKKEIDFLSIDIDGADYLILENLKRKPKILCVEGGFSWNPRLKVRVPDEVAFQNLQQPLAVMFAIAKIQGYVPICFTQNTFFVRQDLYKPFAHIKNDPESLWLDAWHYWEKRYPKERANLINFRQTNPLITAYEKKMPSIDSMLKAKGQKKRKGASKRTSRKLQK